MRELILSIVIAVTIILILFWSLNVFNDKRSEKRENNVNHSPSENQCKYPVPKTPENITLILENNDVKITWQNSDVDSYLILKYQDLKMNLLLESRQTTDEYVIFENEGPGTYYFVVISK